MKWSVQEEEKLKKLYTQTNLTFEEIEKIMGRSVPALSGRLTKLKVKRRYPLKCKLPSSITPALARIHAHICGDGYIYSYKDKDIYGPWAKYRKNPIRTRYRVCYSNNNSDLLKEFRADIFRVFRIKGRKVYKNDIKIDSKKIWKFFKQIDVGNSYNWSIPKEIRSGSENVQKNWIRAFFDDEADFDDDGRIRVKCVNKKGLIQIIEMLKRFVPCHLMPKKGFYWGHTVCININKKDVLDFFSKIGSIRYPMRRRSSVVVAGSS